MADPKMLTNEEDEENFVAEGAAKPVLGANYFAARAIAERFMKQFKVEYFEKYYKEMAEKLADTIGDRMRQDLESFLLSDAESNLGGEIYRRVQRTINVLLSGEGSAFEEHIFRDYDCEAVRAGIAKCIPKQLQDARIVDLEKEVKRLQESLEMYRNR
jgi:hypothetical protein